MLNLKAKNKEMLIKVVSSRHLEHQIKKEDCLF